MITKDNNLKVMELFFKYPERAFHIRELARLTGLSSTGILKIVKRLKNEGLLSSRKERTVELVSPGDNERFRRTKRMYNIESLYHSSLVSYLLKHFEQPEAVILFGSYAQGTDGEKSDIDIAIINGTKTAADLRTFEKKLGRKITLHLLDAKRIEPAFKESLANGIVLEGYFAL